jgi:hypothetical protein
MSSVLLYIGPNVCPMLHRTHTCKNIFCYYTDVGIYILYLCTCKVHYSRHYTCFETCVLCYYTRVKIYYPYYYICVQTYIMYYDTDQQINILCNRTHFQIYIL